MNTTNVKNALRAYKKIKNRGNYSIVYFNKSTGAAWANEYPDSNGYTIYNDANIVNLFRFFNNENFEVVPTAAAIIAFIEKL